MSRVASRLRLAVPGALVNLVCAAATQDDPEAVSPVATDPVATAWVEPVLPAGWVREDPPPEETWAWDADGLLSLQAVEYGGRNERNFDVETETATVIVTARHGDDFRLWLEPDFDGEDTNNNLQEAWGEWMLGPHRWLRVGQFKVALGSEFATRAEDLLFPGYSFIAWLPSRYDSGVQYDSYPNRNFWQQLSAVAGQGFDLDGRDRRTPLFTWRGMLTPDQNEQHEFEGLFGGLAYGWSPDGDDHVYLATPAEQPTFVTNNLDGEETQWLGWELGVRNGPFRWGLETINGVISDVPTGATTNDMDELGSWMQYVAWNFTGDAPRWERGGWAPYTPADHAAGKALPIELGLRYCNADIDRDLFNNGITTYDPSSQETRSISAALSAYTNPNTRLALEWVYIIADHELSVFDGEARTSNLILRWDQWFGR